ncbi:MAG TPA: hypothetical protein VHZ07_01205 [Bryobacteraceae bacterium]|jgi:hypothetical protein|nr:hypothetical protein [Bryobacteraceae bacterium]
MPVDDKHIDLKEVLENQIWYSEREASLNHYASLALMVLALGSTLAASVLAIFSLASEKIVGGIAGLPAVIAIIALTLKLDAISNWNYRKAVKTRTLLRRLMYEGPEPMTTDYIASISAEFNRLDDVMAKERLQNLTLDWASVLRHKPSAVSATRSAIAGRSRWPSIWSLPPSPCGTRLIWTVQFN